MEEFGARFSITDQMTPVLKRINEAIAIMNESLYEAQKNTGAGFDTSGYARVRSLTDEINAELNEMTAKQDRFKSSVRETETAANGLLGKITSIAGAYVGIQGLKALGGVSDSYISTQARLGLVTDDPEGLSEDVFAAAQASRANYSDTLSATAKMGLMAGDEFSSDAEMVRFMELLNKNFVVGGASSGEQSSATFQLMQAMSSGALQGDEYRSIIENAPLLAQAIEDYMRNVEGATGSMKEWAAEGLLTAEVIKEAMFYSADEVEARFNAMPMTLSQIGTVAFNGMYEAAQPVLEGISAGANWVYSNWSTIGPIVVTVAGAVGTYATAMLIAKGVTAAHAVVVGVNNTAKILLTKTTKEEAAATLNSAAADKLSAGAKAHLAVVVGTATTAQKILNAAMYACPILAIVGGVTALCGALGLFGDQMGINTEEVEGLDTELRTLEKDLKSIENASDIELNVRLSTQQAIAEGVAQDEDYLNILAAKKRWEELQRKIAEPFEYSSLDELHKRTQMLQWRLEDVQDVIPGMDALAVVWDGVKFSIEGATAATDDFIAAYADLAKAQAVVDAYKGGYIEALSEKLKAEYTYNQAKSDLDSVPAELDMGGKVSKNWDSLISYVASVQGIETGSGVDAPIVPPPKIDVYGYGKGWSYDAAYSAVEEYLQSEAKGGIGGKVNYGTFALWFSRIYGEDIASAKDAYKNSLNSYNSATDDVLWWEAELDSVLSDFYDAQKEYNEYAAQDDHGNPLLDDMAGNVSSIAKSVDKSKEDLRYIRDLAEREAVNRFTTAEISVNLGGITNHVSSEADLDGVVTYITEQLAEQLSIAAEGVHS